MDKQIIDQFIKNAIAEDLGDGDHTSLSTIPAYAQGQAKLIIKEDGIIAGVELALEIFKQIDPGLTTEVFINDGAAVKYGDIALTVSGSSQCHLACGTSGIKLYAADEWYCNKNQSYC